MVYENCKVNWLNGAIYTAFRNTLGCCVLFSTFPQSDGTHVKREGTRRLSSKGRGCDGSGQDAGGSRRAAWGVGPGREATAGSVSSLVKFRWRG